MLTALPTLALPALSKTAAPSRGATRPRICYLLFAPRKFRGRRESRVPSAPAIVRKDAHGAHQQGAAGTPGLPCAMVLRLMPRSPRRRIPLASVADGLTARSKPGWARQTSASLTPATGARTTRVLPYAASSAKRFDRPMCCRPKFLAKAFKRRSSARRAVAHGKPPCEHLTRPTLPRPPQPAPTFVTMAIRPSLAGQDGRALYEVICGRPTKRNIFASETGQGKSVEDR